MHDSKTGIENIQPEPETFHVVRKEGNSTLNLNNNLYKMVLNYNPESKINMHELILI